MGSATVTASALWRQCYRRRPGVARLGVVAVALPVFAASPRPRRRRSDPAHLPGLLADCSHVIRHALGRIHWVGTETAVHWTGYIEGAVRSGEHAAEEVLAVMAQTR